MKTTKENIQMTRLALGMAGIPGVTDDVAEIVLRVMDGYEKKGGQFSLKDAVDIEIAVKGKATPKRVTFKDK